MPRAASYEALPTMADAELPPPRKRGSSLLWMIASGGFLLMVLFLGLTRSDPVRTRLGIMPILAPSRTRVYLRVGTLGPDGFGSALQHFKQSIVIAGTLDSTLLIASQKSEHKYSTSRIFNGLNNTAMSAADVRNTCRIREYLPVADRDRLVRGLCAGDASAMQEMKKIRAEMAECTSIVDTEEQEITQDLNGCIMGWVRERLLLVNSTMISRLSSPPDRPVTVGVHVRWGDTAGKFGEGFHGSMGISNIVRVLKDLRVAEIGQRGVSLTIAMENADADVLARLNETTYTVLDSGDALVDLRALSNSDVLLLGESSYGVMAHLIAPPGLTLVELAGNYHKYDNTTGFGRNVVFMKDYTPDSLRMP
ncbi:hypothetical protein DFH09DRAFT_1361258 [Mycena vulgaris]|nr:hypothetical protein DFH09DRAFT_1375859 [Mycena vulgaris]KAJ6576872.1 hypothetical protein DFH09DRAFT_1361258 [Mycena vulgaris]